MRVVTVLLISALLLFSGQISYFSINSDDLIQPTEFVLGRSVDTDGDGLSDVLEQTIAQDQRYASLSELNWDSDGDLLPDGWEWKHGLNPNSSFGDDGATGDPDGDGLVNVLEYSFGIPSGWDNLSTYSVLDNGVWWNGTVPTSGWSEEQTLQSNRLNCGDSGSDGSGSVILCDEDPFGNICNDGMDSDGDGYLDAADPDSDGDADCASDDDDGDGIHDEDVDGYDSDNDGMNDGWEIAVGLDPTDPSNQNGFYGDPDNDGLINIYEYVNPNWNSQCDGSDCFRPGRSSETATVSPCNPVLGIGPGGCVSLAAEVDGKTSTNPMNPDTDGDGLNDSYEALTLLTDPTARDTDGDGIDDGVEINGAFGINGNGSLPSDPRDNNTDDDQWDDDEEDINQNGVIDSNETDPTRIGGLGDMISDNSADDDEDSDGIINRYDSCTYGQSGIGLDTDGDGCKNGEDHDDDNDGIWDAFDNCSSGDIGWISNSQTDYDMDGCQDSDEDDDDDNDGLSDDVDSELGDSNSCFPLRTGEVISMQEATGSSVSAEVMYSGVNAAILLDEDISINTHWNSFWARLINLGTLIDVLIIPKLIVLYGFEPPDVDGNCQIKVLVYDIDGAFGTLGYFAPSMASTQENLYIDADDVEQLSDVNWTSSLAAHELSHLMMNSIDPSENLWVDEGVADYIAGFITGSNYILRSHVNSWTTDSGIGLRWWNQRIADYGASTLMMAYLHGHLGDQAFADLLNSQQQGAIGVQTILAQYAANNTIGTDFSSLFANFTVAAGLDFEGTIWDIPRIELADTCGQQACVIQAQDSGEFYASASPIQFSFSSQSELESWGVHRYVFDNVTEGTLSVISNTSSAEFNGIIAILESDGDVRTQSFEAPENDGVRGRLITSDVDRIEVYVWDETGGDCDYTSCGPTYPIIDYELDVILSFSDDTDEDGVEDLLDDCPFGESNWTSSPSTDQDADGCKDANEDDDDDGDGIEDQYDAFPDDPTEFEDSDGDGVGDNSDLFPQDGNESEDSDGDGVGDNADAFPADGNESEDSDGDGVGDNADAFPNDANETVDSDGDGVGDYADAFPDDVNETTDSDDDGVGDNADHLPFDANETVDSDGDGIGDNTDEFPFDRFEFVDSDGDGIGDNGDAFPNDANETADSDGDGIGDNGDAFPNDANETADSDGDGIGDNGDAFPNDANETVDSDQDGVGDNGDAFPEDANETVDSDQDGVGDNGDDFPEDANETVDSDQDGVGDNGDAFPNDPDRNESSNGSELLNFLGFGLSTGDIVGIAIALIGSLISIVFAISRRATKKKRLKLIKTLLDKIERSQSDVELSSVNKEIDKMFKDDLLSSDNLALLSTKIRNRKDEVQDTHHFSRNEVQEIHHSPSSKYT